MYLGLVNFCEFPICWTVTFFPGNVCFPEANQEEGKHHEQAAEEACDQQHQRQISLFMNFFYMAVVIP